MLDKEYICLPSKATKESLYDVIRLPAFSKSKQLFIFESASMEDVISSAQSEEIRARFLENDVRVRQITNIPKFPEFTWNKEFVNQVMQFRYVPKEIFDIKKEIAIFDDKVAVYDNDEILIIEDQSYADSQRQLFESIWKEGESPKLDFEYIPNHSFYKSVDLNYDNLQVIVWPDADSTDAYKWFSYEDLRKYVQDIIESDRDYFDNCIYIISFIWSLDWEKVIDMWKFDDNSVDDRSWPLSEARVYKEWKVCTDIWLSSWNTLLVLWYEEKMRRQSESIDTYLKGPAPQLPLEMMNGLDFFNHNK